MTAKAQLGRGGAQEFGLLRSVGIMTGAARIGRYRAMHRLAAKGIGIVAVQAQLTLGGGQQGRVFGLMGIMAK